MMTGLKILEREEDCMSDLMEVQRRYFAVQLERAQKRPGVQ